MRDNDAPLATPLELLQACILKAHIQIFCGHASECIKTPDSYMLLDPLYPEILLQFLAEARLAPGDFEAAAGVLATAPRPQSGGGDVPT